MDDLKLLYRAYVTDSLSSGRMEEDKVGGFNFSLLHFFCFFRFFGIIIFYLFAKMAGKFESLVHLSN